VATPSDTEADGAEEPRACPSDDRLLALLEGELPEESRKELQEHIAGCASCRKLVAATARGYLAHLTGAPAVLPPGVTVGRYVVLGLLGAGGMGQVYRARDASLEREVAVKILPPAPRAGPDLQRRFEQEARLAGSLHHPNILAIYDVGTHEGLPYVVSEILEGETLRDLLSRTALPARKVVDVANQIALGLAAAHRRGIVHRDLKPENLFITEDGRVKILDFGLAKLCAPDSPSGMAEVGEVGTLVGTVPYMSPEQVRGEEVDPRSDIFSLGAILYEMLAGRRAFQAESAAQTMNAILTEDPPPLPTPGSSLERVARRCLEKKPAERFQSARDVAFALEAISESSPSAVLPRRRRARIGAMVVAALAILGAVVGVLLSVSSPRPPPDSLAVLPFVNASRNADAEYLSDGITESLIHRLSRIPDLRVIARATVFRYKGRRIDPRTVAQSLGVQAVLVGQVVQRGEALSIGAELVSARDGSLLWGDRFRRKVSDILEIQEEITAAIAEKLQLRLSRHAKRPTANAEAYPLYLNGRHHWNRRLKGVRAAVRFFERAIEKDPAFALAYTGLADSYSAMGSWESGELDPRDAFPKAEAAAQRALDLDGQLAEAHASLAYVRMNQRDWTAAEREFQRAIELDPRYPTAHHWYSHYLVVRGRIQESLAASKRALELDPLDELLNAHLAWNYWMAHEHDLAIEQCRKTLQLYPTSPQAHFFAGLAYEQESKIAEAIAAFEKARELSGGSQMIVGMLGHALAVSGRGDEARQVLAELRERSKRAYVSSYEVAVIHAGLAEDAEALRWLQRADEERSSWLLYLKADPRLARLRADARFASLLSASGSPKSRRVRQLRSDRVSGTGRERSRNYALEPSCVDGAFCREFVRPRRGVGPPGSTNGARDSRRPRCGGAPREHRKGQCRGGAGPGALCPPGLCGRCRAGGLRPDLRAVAAGKEQRPPEHVGS
jgi:serine/threonine-protein kinase